MIHNDQLKQRLSSWDAERELNQIAETSEKLSPGDVISPLIAEAKNDGLTLQHFLVWLKFAFAWRMLWKLKTTIIKISFFHTKSADCVMIESQSAVEGFRRTFSFLFQTLLRCDRNLLWLMISMPVDFMFSGEKKKIIKQHSELEWNGTNNNFLKATYLFDWGFIVSGIPIVALTYVWFFRRNKRFLLYLDLIHIISSDHRVMQFHFFVISFWHFPFTLWLRICST